MRLYNGCDLLLFAKVTTDTKDIYIAERPQRLEALCSVSLPPSRSVTTVYKDGIPINAIGQRNDSNITIRTLALTEKLRAYLLGEETIGGYFIDTGKAGAPYFALGFRLINTDNTFKYYWYNKGTFSFNARTVETREGTKTSKEEIIFTPVITNKLFNGKPCKSISVDSFSNTHDINGDNWSATVWTPETLESVTKPVILPNENNIAVGDFVTIVGNENINYGVREQ